MNSVRDAVRGALTPFRSERALHVCVLCAFAFSEPLFAALTQQFVYMHDLEAGWGEVAYVVLMLTVVIPAGWILLDYLVMHGSSRYRGRGRNLVLTVLTGIVWLSLLRPFMKFPFLMMQSSIWLASLIIATVGAILSVQIYQRSVWFRRWVSVATLGLVCFPGAFLYQFSSLRQIEEQLPATPIEHPVPVVFVVFDEISGTTLMDRDLQIDAQHFPQFARLANLSTWYRHASTVHTRTNVAVPALLSGQFPTVKRQPLESEYPDNLFRLIFSTGAYEMNVFEPICRLCPNAVRKQKQVHRSPLQKIASLTWTLASVYPRLILPRDMPIEFPPISRMWFGLPENFAESQNAQSGLYRTGPFLRRDDQLRQFLQNLHTSDKPPSDKPQFSFLHIELPHVPWCFLPSGRYYNYDEANAFHPAGAWGDIGEDWSSDSAIIARNEHRYLQQVRYVDGFVGQLLDRLQEVDVLDDCLLVVTADHGVSFRPGHSRRVPDAENLSDLLSIPLFVKLPGQHTGSVSDSNVESIDILPTIAEVLGMTLTGPIDGVSVSDETRRHRKTLYYDNGMTVLEPSIPQLNSAVDRRLAIFGADSLDFPPLQASSHPDWHGRSTNEFTIEDRPLPSLQISPNSPVPDSGSGEFVPCIVGGTLDPREFPGSAADLVLAVNNVIRDSGPTFAKGRGVHGFEFLLPESVVQRRPCQVELFHAERTTSDQPRLRRLGNWILYE